MHTISLGSSPYQVKQLVPDAAEDDTSLVRTQPRTLSLYVTSVMLEFAHADYEISASMFAGIKCQDDRAGERGARHDWAWEFWQNDWVFREDSEVWGMCTTARHNGMRIDGVKPRMSTTPFVFPIGEPQNTRDRFLRDLCSDSLSHWSFLPASALSFVCTQGSP